VGRDARDAWRLSEGRQSLTAFPLSRVRERVG
jgi:hypothetical protein